MVLTGNKAKPLSLVNHTTKTIHHHHCGEGEVDFHGKGGARFEVVLELHCISREEGGLVDIKNGG